MDQSTISEIESFIKSIKAEDVSSLQDQILKFLEEKKQKLSADEIAKKLQECRKKISESIAFSEGDLVKWKDGLKNRRFPNYGEPAIIMEVLDEPVYNDDEDPSSPYYKEKLTIRIGFIVDGGTDFLVYLVDKRRFEKYG